LNSDKDQIIEHEYHSWKKWKVGAQEILKYVASYSLCRNVHFRDTGLDIGLAISVKTCFYLLWSYISIYKTDKDMSVSWKTISQEETLSDFVFDVILKIKKII
jgi:hypothetical protein